MVGEDEDGLEEEEKGEEEEEAVVVEGVLCRRSWM
jgi:hypothetical protein